MYREKLGPTCTANRLLIGLYWLLFQGLSLDSRNAGLKLETPPFTCAPSEGWENTAKWLVSLQLQQFYKEYSFEILIKPFEVYLSLTFTRPIRSLND
jgi:hypothetical protein